MLFYIIETQEQFEAFKGRYFDQIYIDVIPFNDNYHPKLQQGKISLIYLRPLNFHKGFLLGINHSETFSLSLEEITEYLSKREKLFTLNKKNLLYHFPTFTNLYDTTFIHKLNNLPLIKSEEHNTPAHNILYARHRDKEDINKIIPISKHYEKHESIFSKINFTLADTINDSRYRKCNYSLTENYYYLENNGIKIDENAFSTHFGDINSSLFIRDNLAYSQYNLYTTTMRPSNSVGGLNLLALNKNNDEREIIVPQNDYLVEFDYKSFHLHLLCNLVRYDFTSTDIHSYLGKIYYNKEELTQEEYKDAKQRTFGIIYTQKIKDYLHIDFFKKVYEYKQQHIHKQFIEGELCDMELTQETQLFPYILQQSETVHNLEILKALKYYLADKKTKVILYGYDSFLFDYSKADGKQCLEDIQRILQKYGYKVGVSYGKKYNCLKEL